MGFGVCCERAQQLRQLGCRIALECLWVQTLGCRVGFRAYIGFGVGGALGLVSRLYRVQGLQGLLQGFRLQGLGLKGLCVLLGLRSTELRVSRV